MPSIWVGRGRRVIKRFCERPYTWSTLRDGCRFGPGHEGLCKPGRY